MKIGKLRYSGQAKVIMANLKEETFDIDKFEEWVKTEKFITGGGYIIEYMDKQKKGEL